MQTKNRRFWDYALTRAVLCLFFCCFFGGNSFAAGPPPVITAQPLDTVVVYGGTATFTVAASSGTALSYQWYKDELILDTQLAGQIFSTLTLNNVGDSDVGQYYVEVRNAGGTVNSRHASLAVVTNSLPIANNDNYSTLEDVSLVLPAAGVLTNDTDVNGQALTAVLITNVIQGSLNLNTNGAFTYIPPTNYSGSVSFTYRASDGYPMEQNNSGGNKIEVKKDKVDAQSFRHGTAGEATYMISRIVIYLSREAAVGNGNLNFTIGTGLNSGTVAGSAVAISSVSITNTTSGISCQTYGIDYSTPVGPFTAGTTYYLNFDNQTGKKVFVEYANANTYANGTYYDDGVNQNKDVRFQIYENANSNPATVTINVIPVNDPPTAVNDGTNTLEGVSVTVNVLANDSDVEGSSLTITGTSTTNGAAVISSTNIIFTPFANFYGTTVFAYTVSDGGNSTTGNVTVVVMPRPPSITSQPQSQTVTQGLTASFFVVTDGTAPLSYQWKYLGNNLPGATGATLVLTNAQLVQAGNYSVTVTNVAGTAVSAPASLTVALPAGSDLPVMQDLVAHLTFDGNLADSSGHGNHAAAVRAPNIVPGFIGTGGFNPFTQNGTNNYATFGSPSDLSFGTNTHFSIAFWARLPAGGWGGSSYYEPPFICNKNFTTYANVGWALATGANGQLEWNYSEGTPTNYFGPAGTFGSTNWHHVAVTFQRGGKGVCYLDGVPVSTNSISPGGGSIDTGLPTNIGNDGTGSYSPAYGYFTNAFGNPVKGLNMDDVGIWRRALSRTEVRAIYNVGLAGEDLASVTSRDVSAPIAVNDSTNTWEDVSVTVNVLANDSDPESSPLTITGTSTTNGTAIINGNNVVFTPSANFNGTATFYYNVSDGTLTSTGNVTVTVAAVPDVPVANNDTYTIPEDAMVAISGVLLNDTDGDGDVLTALLVSTTTNGSLSLNANGSFIYAPNSNYFGSDSFLYRARQSAVSFSEENNVGGDKIEVRKGKYGAQSFRYGVAGDRDYTISKIGLYLSRESALPATNPTFSIGTGTNSGAIAGSSVTIPASSITNTSSGTSFQTYEIAYATPVGPFTAGTTYYLNLNNPTDKRLFVEYADANTYTNGTYFDDGTDKIKDIRFHVRGAPLSDVATVTINVTNINDAPVANVDWIAALEDVPVTMTVLTNDFDVEGSLLTITGASTTNGTAVVSGTNIIFTAATNYSGWVVMSYTISDGNASATGYVGVLVFDVNDAPVPANDTYSTLEDVPLNIVAPGVIANDTDVETNALFVWVWNNVTHGILNLNTNGGFTYVPYTNYTGTDSFTYLEGDGEDWAATLATVTINVTPVNDAPATYGDTYTTLEDTTLTILAGGVLTNDTDVEGDALTALLVSSVSHGSLSLNTNGGFTYTPTDNYIGSDSFTYRASDGSANSALTTVSLTILDTPMSFSSATMTPAGFKLHLIGVSSSNCVIYASTNFKDWTPISTNTPSSGNVDFTDTSVTNQPSRYYRALEE